MYLSFSDPFPLSHTVTLPCEECGSHHVAQPFPSKERFRSFWHEAEVFANQSVCVCACAETPFVRARARVCVYAPPCQSIDWWLPEESESLSMRDNLSDAVYLSLPGSHSHTLSLACPFSLFLLPSPAAIHSDLMFMYLTMSSCSSVLLCQRSLLLLRFSLSVSLPPLFPRRKGPEI